MKKFIVGIKTVMYEVRVIEAETKAEAKAQIPMLAEMGKLNQSKEESFYVVEEWK